MLTIETKEFEISKDLLRKVEMICKFACVKPTITNGNVKNIKETNIDYVKPHIIKINNIDLMRVMTYLLMVMMKKSLRTLKPTLKAIFNEELGNEAIFGESLFELLMEFDEIATSDGVTPIHFYVFKYNGKLNGKLNTSEEIEKFKWYDSSCGTDILSNTLKNEVVPYCTQRKLIK